MPVNLSPPSSEALLDIAGVRIGVTEASIRKPGQPDLLVLALEPGTALAAVFTQNRFCAAPVMVARQHLCAGNAIRALMVNTGNANAGTGDDGISRARACCDELARLLDCPASAILPFSTGVIMEPLPLGRIVAGLPTAVASLGTASWLDAARAIMTTDTVPKAVSCRARVGVGEVRVTGIAKGSGMIHPNMATMLGFIATDAAVSPETLDAILRRAVDDSFNRITVDGDTSTNDACVLIATGKTPMAEVTDPESGDAQALQLAVSKVARTLAHSIVRDGEGATKFIEIRVEGGASVAECKQVAYAIARSPLVKTAFFASDPNLGRILAAIGYAGITDLDVGRVRLWLGDLLVAENGGRAPSYREEDGRRAMNAPEIQARIDLGRGNYADTIWTCDLSYDYVKINAEYRT